VGRRTSTVDPGKAGSLERAVEGYHCGRGGLEHVHFDGSLGITRCGGGGELVVGWFCWLRWTMRYALAPPPPYPQSLSLLDPCDNVTTCNKHAL